MTGNDEASASVSEVALKVAPERPGQYVCGNVRIAVMDYPGNRLASLLSLSCQCPCERLVEAQKRPPITILYRLFYDLFFLKKIGLDVYEHRRHQGRVKEE